MAIEVLLVPYQAGGLVIGFDRTHLKPRDARLLELLVRRKGTTLEEADAAAELWGNDGIEWELGELQHSVSRLRRMLRPVGIEIRSIFSGSWPNRRLRGWQLFGPISIHSEAK